GGGRWGAPAREGARRPRAAPTRRSPSERDLRAPDVERLPPVRKLKGVAVPPPDVPAVGIEELDLELVRGRRAANLHVDRPGLRHPAGEELAGNDEATPALEVIVESERATPGAGIAMERQLSLPGDDGAPAGDVAEVVENFHGHGTLRQACRVAGWRRHEAVGGACRWRLRHRPRDRGSARARTAEERRCTRATAVRARAGPPGSGARRGDRRSRHAR